MSSDSDLASVVAELQLDGYVAAMTITAVLYDYIITLSKEIRYIWKRPWTFVSVMFIVVRYVGLFVAITDVILGTVFLPGPTLIKGTVIYIASDYAFNMFLAAADVVMILRVYAMYNKSKIVLGLLLVLYIATIVLYVMSSVYYNNTHSVLSMTNPQIFGMSICNPVYNIDSNIGEYKLIPRLTLAALMFVLAVARFFKDSYRAYKETRTWETNRYIRLLVSEGILYFFAHLFNTMSYGFTTANGTIIVHSISFVVMILLSPRFIINVREMYLHNLLRVSGRPSGMDTGFGLSKGRSTQPTTGTVSSVGLTRSVQLVSREESVEMQVVGKDAYA